MKAFVPVFLGVAALSAVLIPAAVRAAPLDGADGWSKPERGLQARVTLVEKPSINGTRSLVPYLELRSVCDSACPLKVRCGGAHVRFELVDSNGKVVREGSSLPRSGPHPDPGTIVLPHDSSMRIGMYCSNWGVPKDAAAMVSTNSGAWVLEQKENGMVFLRATIKGAKVEADPDLTWHGMIQVPLVKIDWTDDEAAVAACIKALSDAKSEMRKAAAADLRRIVAKYPSGTIYLTSKDGGEAIWREKVDLVTPGMSKTEVLKLLPRFPEAADGIEVSSGDSHIVVYRLDYHWTVKISYRNTGKVISRPVLHMRALKVEVTPPKDFTGTWITWHVNGQKGWETQYTNGKYDGVLTMYHDNGVKSVEQHYVNHEAHGADTGWYPNGKLCYTAQYRNGKQDGKWTHWYANGNRQCETNYDNGKYNGLDSRWHENGQLGAVNAYKDGIKHGIEASWDEKGVLQYERKFVNGEIVE
jgi:hypothetical protein